MAESTRPSAPEHLRAQAPVSEQALPKIEAQDIRALCERIVDRDAPATAIHVREQIKLILAFAFARLHGVKFDNPASVVRPASISTFTPRERSLSPREIRIFHPLLESVPTLPTFRPRLKLILPTLVRQSELRFAT